MVLQKVCLVVSHTTRWKPRQDEDDEDENINCDHKKLESLNQSNIALLSIQKQISNVIASCKSTPLQVLPCKTVFII